jgi:hypothetical protein
MGCHIKLFRQEASDHARELAGFFNCHGFEGFNAVLSPCGESIAEEVFAEFNAGSFGSTFGIPGLTFYPWHCI